MLCIGIDVGCPRVSNHRCINLISSACEWLMRAPSERSSLLVVCDSMSAVISTACAWCMIMPCMNSTSFADKGGRLARVDEGKVRVGCPGAPGCTTTGLDDCACVQTEIANKRAIVKVAKGKLRQAVITERILLLG